VALHPVDIMDASTGRLLTQLVDANLATICPVNKPHPRLNVIVSGSSRSLYAWRPVQKGAHSFCPSSWVHF
jgi:DNA damage-binding protein 2